MPQQHNGRARACSSIACRISYAEEFPRSSDRSTSRDPQYAHRIDQQLPCHRSHCRVPTRWKPMDCPNDCHSVRNAGKRCKAFSVFVAGAARIQGRLLADAHEEGVAAGSRVRCSRKRNRAVNMIQARQPCRLVRNRNDISGRPVGMEKTALHDLDDIRGWIVVLPNHPVKRTPSSQAAVIDQRKKSSRRSGRSFRVDRYPDSPQRRIDRYCDARLPRHDRIRFPTSVACSRGPHRILPGYRE